MSQPLQLAPQITIPLHTASCSSSARSSGSTDRSEDREPPESYIRELASLVEAPGEQELQHELGAVRTWAESHHLTLELHELDEATQDGIGSASLAHPPPLPRLHPILNPSCPLEDLPASLPPKVSLLWWLWLALTLQ